MIVRPKLMFIGTGGTISCRTSDPLDVLDYPEFNTKLDAADLVAGLPGSVHSQYDLVAVSFSRINSNDIGPLQWIELAQLIARAFDEDPDLRGVVVGHGTATLEETAYALDLVLKTDRPVVMTAAQRPASAVGADGPPNLIAALRTAAAPDAGGKGVLVVLNDEIHAARHVTKSLTYRLQTFVSPEAGPLGVVDGDGPHFAMAPVKRHTVTSAFTVEHLRKAPRVDISYGYAGADGSAPRAFAANGAKGIVSAGMLPGLVPAAERAALEEARAGGCVVVQATRGLGGRVAARRGLRDMGFVAAGSLNPQKARILLMIALAVTTDVTEIQTMFDTY